MKHLKLASLIALILTMTLFSACSKGKASSPLIGTWVITEAQGSMAKLNKGTSYNFKEDGTVIMKKGFENKAKYTFVNGELTIKVGSVTLKSNITINKNMMTMKVQKSDQVFTLKKK